MQAATTQTATGLSADEDYPNAKNLKPNQISNHIGLEPVRNALQGLAELRRYILEQHPALLKEAGPALVRAEVGIFDVWGQLRKS